MAGPWSSEREHRDLVASSIFGVVCQKSVSQCDRCCGARIQDRNGKGMAECSGHPSPRDPQRRSPFVHAVIHSVPGSTGTIHYFPQAFLALSRGAQLTDVKISLIMQVHHASQLRKGKPKPFVESLESRRLDQNSTTSNSGSANDDKVARNGIPPVGPPISRDRLLDTDHAGDAPLG